MSPCYIFIVGSSKKGLNINKNESITTHDLFLYRSVTRSQIQARNNLALDPIVMGGS